MDSQMVFSSLMQGIHQSEPEKQSTIFFPSLADLSLAISKFFSQFWAMEMVANNSKMETDKNFFIFRD